MNLFISPHNDDESLFGAFTLMREHPLVLVVTDGWIQFNRGDRGCHADIRREETIKAMEILKCPVTFLGIKDTELTEGILTKRLIDFQHLGFEKVYAPAIQGGNWQHDLIGLVAGRTWSNIRRYTTYTKTELWTKGEEEIIPTKEEIELKEKALWCYQSQINLPATRPHFEAVLGGKSEWLI